MDRASIEPFRLSNLKPVGGLQNWKKASAVFKRRRFTTRVMRSLFEVLLLASKKPHESPLSSKPFRSHFETKRSRVQTFFNWEWIESKLGFSKKISPPN